MNNSQDGIRLVIQIVEAVERLRQALEIDGQLVKDALRRRENEPVHAGLGKCIAVLEGLQSAALLYYNTQRTMCASPMA
jgi:hypothetical protein